MFMSPVAVKQLKSNVTKVISDGNIGHLFMGISDKRLIVPMKTYGGVEV
jgi:uncharacterized radical SAM superfamily protein